jgi:MoaA/NifB/PqqE/SkfB family radical SAM enzyme
MERSMDYKAYFYTNEIVAMQNGCYVHPVTCEIDLSNKCQLNCKFCMYKKQRKAANVDLDFELYHRLILDLKRTGVKSVTFTGGGEPLMNPRREEMIRHAAEMGLEMGMVTNGINLNLLPKTLLSQFKFIRISLDAATDRTYKKLKKQDYFYEVTENADWFVRLFKGKVTIGFSFVTCEENEHEVYQAEKLAREIGVDYIQFKPAWTGQDIYREGSYRGDADQQSVILMDRFKPENKLPCTIAALVGIVGADGKVYYCCQHRGNPDYSFGDLHEKSFHTIMLERNKITPDLNDCPQCRYMNYAKKFEEIPPFLIEHRHFL